MSFKKYHEKLKESLSFNDITEPTEFQKKVLSKIKGGANVLAVNEENVGKTTAIIISVINSLKAEAYADVPRAIIFVKDKEACLELEEEFKKYLGNTDLRIFSAYDEGNINYQKDAIYVGMDIVIGTPERLSKIYFVNGLNLSNLKMLVVDDADLLKKNTDHTNIHRITESLDKCQYVVFAKTANSRVEKLRELFLENAHYVK